MLSGTGVGVLTAAWMIAAIGSLQRGRAFVATGVGLVSAGLVGLSQAPNLLLAISCCALIGFGLILFLATSQSVVQLGTAADNRGVIMGNWAATLSSALPLGTLLAGPAADYWGLPLVPLPQ